MRTCPKCKTEYADDKRFCKSCGIQLLLGKEADPKVTAREMVSKEKIKAKSIKIISIVIGASLAILSIIVLIKYVHVQNEDEVWTDAVKANTPISYNSYIKEYPEGKHIAEALSAKEESFWIGVQRVNNEISYNNFLKAYPNGKYTENAKQGILTLYREGVSTPFQIEGIQRQDEDRINIKNNNPIDGILPAVKIHSDSTAVIAFTTKQLDAINKFTHLHPDVDLLTSNNIDQITKVENIKYYMSGEMQYQYSCWGDLDNDNILDVMVVFKSKTSINISGWRNFYFVLLKGQKDGTYFPIKIFSFEGGCLDGLLYHKKENIIEYFCSGVAAGTIKWNNGQFIIKKLGGD